MPTARIRGKQVDLEYCERNPYRLLQQGLATIVRIAQSDDNKHALLAGQWLCEYGERLMDHREALKAQPVKAQLADRAAIISELRGLYAKALGEAPLIVQAEPESAPAPEAAKPPRD